MRSLLTSFTSLDSISSGGKKSNLRGLALHGKSKVGNRELKQLLEKRRKSEFEEFC